MKLVTTVDPRDGRDRGTDLTETGEERLKSVVAHAAESGAWLDELGRSGRARLLDAIAGSIESARGSAV